MRISDWSSDVCSSDLLSGKPDGTYSYRVRACSGTSTSTCGAYSAVDSIIVDAPPDAPLLIVPTGSSNGNYTVSWSTVSGATRYRLDEKVETGSWSQILEGSATDLEFYARAPGSYSYRVRACGTTDRSEEHTSELQSLMRISYAVFC